MAQHRKEALVWPAIQVPFSPVLPSARCEPEVFFSPLAQRRKEALVWPVLRFPFIYHCLPVCSCLFRRLDGVSVIFSANKQGGKALGFPSLYLSDFISLPGRFAGFPAASCGLPPRWRHSGRCASGEMPAAAGPCRTGHGPSSRPAADPAGRSARRGSP